MHKVFGVKEKAEYVDREGAYLIPVLNNKIGVIKTDKRYFWLGGGFKKMKATKNALKKLAIPL